MTRELYELSLEELKALYDVGRLSKNDLLVQDQWGGTVFHNLAEYNPDAFNIFQWLVDIEWIIRDDLFIKNNHENTELHSLARKKDALSIFSWLKDLEWITKDDLFRKNNDGNTVLYWLADNEYTLSIFSWLKDIKWITKDDLFIKNNNGRTVVHWLANHEDVLSIFQWLVDLKWITKDDLFIKNNYGKTVLDYLTDENKEKVLALFNDKEKDNNLIKGNFVQKTTEKNFFDLEVDFVLKNLNIVDSDLEGDSQVYLSVGDLKETEKVTLEFNRINETIISLKILRNLKNKEKIFEQDYEIDKTTFKKIIKINI